ncbi:hypothetical protein NIA69_09455 [Gemmiger formicilis]|nr:hypothetical protein [Gemmiger formicilis]
MGKDFCLFNHINDLSRQFALDLQQGEGDVAARIESDAIYQLSAFYPRKTSRSFCAAAPAALLCDGARISVIFCPRAAASLTAWPTRWPI